MLVAKCFWEKIYFNFIFFIDPFCPGIIYIYFFLIHLLKKNFQIISEFLDFQLFQLKITNESK